MLNALTSLTILSLISITIPGLARIVDKAILEFSQLDILPTNIIYPAMFTFDDDIDGPLNESFNLGGYSSMNAIRNL